MSTQAKRLCRKDLVCCVFLIAVTVLLFCKSLQFGFFADDYLEIDALHQASEHGFLALFSQTLKPWQDKNIQLFFRPVPEASLIFNYLIGGRNPFVFHLTNILLHAACCCLIYILGRLIDLHYYRRNLFWPWLLGALLFCAYPANNEVVVWIVGRVDSLALLFYLMSLCFYLSREESHRWSGISSVFMFLLGLFSKETTATLPLVIFCIELFRESRVTKEIFYKAILNSAPFLCALAIFLLLRGVFLGSMIGGYIGSYGESFKQLPYGFSLSQGFLTKLLLPYNEGLLVSTDVEVTALRLATVLIGIALLLKASFDKTISQINGSIFFLCAWFFANTLLVLPYAFVQNTLSNSRFLYMPVAALSLVLTSSLLLWKNKEPEPKTSSATRFFASSVLFFCVLVFFSLNYRGLSCWQDSSTLSTNLMNQLITVLSNESQTNTIIVNCPSNVQGAHLLYNQDMLQAMLKTHSGSQELGKNLGSLQMHFRPELVNLSLVRRLSKRPHTKLYEWREKNLVPLQQDAPRLKTNTLAEPINVSFQKEGADGVFVSEQKLDINPGAFEFLEITLEPELLDNLRFPVATLEWNTNPDKANKANKAPRTDEHKLEFALNQKQNKYFLPIGEQKSWFTSNSINNIQLHIPTSAQQQKNIKGRLFTRYGLIPILEPNQDIALGPDSELILQPDGLELKYDASSISGAQSVILEVSKCNSYFDHYTGKLHDTQLSPFSQKRIASEGRKGILFINSTDLHSKGHYQIRAFALDKESKVRGYSSDPLELAKY